MKKIMASVLIVTVLSFWIPGASAEISQDLDPMVPVDSQAIVAPETSASGVTTVPTSHGVSAAAATTDEKKVEEPKKEKSKKSSKKKSSEKKKTKPSKNPKKNKPSSR